TGLLVEVTHGAWCVAVYTPRPLYHPTPRLPKSTLCYNNDWQSHYLALSPEQFHTAHGIRNTHHVPGVSMSHPPVDLSLLKPYLENVAYRGRTMLLPALHRAQSLYG